MSLSQKARTPTRSKCKEQCSCQWFQIRLKTVNRWKTMTQMISELNLNNYNKCFSLEFMKNKREINPWISPLLHAQYMADKFLKKHFPVYKTLGLRLIVLTLCSGSQDAMGCRHKHIHTRTHTRAHTHTHTHTHTNTHTRPHTCVHTYTQPLIFNRKRHHDYL